jgi:hypothetical protein
VYGPRYTTRAGGQTPIVDPLGWISITVCPTRATRANREAAWNRIVSTSKRDRCCSAFFARVRAVAGRRRQDGAHVSYWNDCGGIAEPETSSKGSGAP